MYNWFANSFKYFYDIYVVWPFKRKGFSYGVGNIYKLVHCIFYIHSDGACQKDWLPNRHEGFQLNISQKVITLVVFAVFAVVYPKEPFQWKYLVSFAILLEAVYFIFKK